MTGPDSTPPTAALPESPSAEMPTTECKACTHPDAAAIDEALLGGTAIRTVAETYGLSRSAVGRHKLNHLSVQTITDPGDAGELTPLRIVDVHRQLTALAGRLEKVVEIATRTRKATAAVGATRELRQTYEALAKLQADPALQHAADAEAVREAAKAAGTGFLVNLISFLVQEFVGLDPHGEGVAAKQVSAVIAACLRVPADELTRSSNPFATVDTAPARKFRERQAMDRAKRMEAEVQQRVEAELRRREEQARPAIEARERVAIEGGVVWTA